MLEDIYLVESPHVLTKLYAIYSKKQTVPTQVEYLAQMAGKVKETEKEL